MRRIPEQVFFCQRSAINTADCSYNKVVLVTRTMQPQFSGQE